MITNKLNLLKKNLLLKRTGCYVLSALEKLDMFWYVSEPLFSGLIKQIFQRVPTLFMYC